MPKVSVIIPNYNHSNYLQQRIDSVLNQSFNDFEIIILDDCSTDNSRNIIEEYKGNPLIKHILYNEKNSGSTFIQWKKGLASAQGEYIWIAESDDFSSTFFLEEIMKKMYENENCAFAYCRTTSIDETGKTLGINNWGELIEPAKWEMDFVMEGKEFIQNFLCYRNVIPNASAVIINKKYIQGIYLNEKMKYAGDWLFWVELAAKGSVAFIAKPMNYFRQHAYTTRGNKPFKNEMGRIREYFTVIRTAHKIIQSRLNSFNKHYNWILDEWRYKSIRVYKFKALFPPYPAGLLFRFYKRLLLKK